MPQKLFIRNKTTNVTQKSVKDKTIRNIKHNST